VGEDEEISIREVADAIVDAMGYTGQYIVSPQQRIGIDLALSLSLTIPRQTGSTENLLVMRSCLDRYGIPRPNSASRPSGKVCQACFRAGPS
jgi:hypothetical protein